MRFNKKILFIPLFLITVLTISYFSNKFYAKKEYQEKINFVISRIEVTPALRCIFYNTKGEELDIHGYTFFERDGIKVSDSIAKDQSSSMLRIYRINPKGKYEILSKIELKYWLQ